MSAGDAAAVAIPDPAALAATAQSVLLAEAAALTAAASRIGPSFTGALQAVLAHSGKLVVTGLGKSGHVARKVAATLSSTGTPAFFLHPSEALHGDFGMLQSADSLLAIAYGGETTEVLEVARFARRIGCTVVALTGKPDSSLGRLGHFVLDASVEREADPLDLAPTSSSTTAMAIGDAFAVSLMHARGFTPQDFASLHPGGSLGRRLSLVRDHMLAGNGLPKVGEKANFHEILAAVTVGNVGIAAVEDSRGDLIGSISDGDLRRALLRLDAKALACLAGDLMTRSPVTISAGALALDAVATMNRLHISRLFVVGGDNPRQALGLIRLQDLLAAKIL